MTGPSSLSGRTAAAAPRHDDAALVGFRHHLRPATVPGEATYLVSRQGVTAVHGPLAEVLVPLLDGTRSLTQIRSATAGALTAEQTEEGLRLLGEAGLLRYTDPATTVAGADPVAEAYFDLAGLDGARAAAGLEGSRLAILPLAGVDAAPVLAAGAESGLSVTDTGADLTLVLCDDYLSPELAWIDAEHRAAGRPWLLTKLCGYEPWIGPFFGPGEGPCWSCLAYRLEQHRGYEAPLQQALGLDRPLARPTASLSAGRVLAAHSAVLEAAKWLAGLRYADQGAVRTVDTLTLRTRVHTVTRIPQCPSCGEPGLAGRRAGRPFVAVSRPKAAGAGGNGHRALTPDQLLRRHAHLVSPITGIVPHLEPSPGAPEFATTYVSGHNLAMRGRGGAGLRAQSGGKGLTDTEAKTSALCEAVERYCGTRHGDEPVVVDTLRALGDQAIHPNACQLFAQAQFADRARWNRSGSPFHHVPEPFEADRPVEWTPVWSMTAQRPRLLPTSMLYYSPTGAGGPYADSNGNAAGSSLEDALLQGFLELVERDAVALWWYNRTRQPAVDLEGFGEPYIARLREGHHRLGRELWALDLTADLGIPTMVALSRRTDGPAEDIVFGFGAHFDPAIALRRALTEAGQLLPAVNRDRPGGGYGVSDPLPVRWWQQATLANQPYLAPDPAAAPRTPASWSYVPRGDLLDDVTAVTDLVASMGLELLVLDQTRPDVELPVVKVIVPGLRHFWARYAPGRLFDTPVALGRLAAPTAYEQLNPIPLFV
ncbi:hypothetical protein DN069_12385 [Streptacidiphilus pinicola]|uniref:YcaO domain-containing protein n=1 Tax=Streptacidiphilus pinicola TaxID=2219663 RepID=A0A2X0JCL5_9ACTN|nr:TOMM precursor leader peptide-binding protein [Streptacidiphilus pinicola]RAG85328.1 hypothetical protein DN069_12385 [Streptacidiphilus pinicola]